MVVISFNRKLDQFVRDEFSSGRFKSESAVISAAVNLLRQRSRCTTPQLQSDPVIEAYKKDVDRTLLRENLKLTPEERIQKLMELQRFAEELRRAGQREENSE